MHRHLMFLRAIFETCLSLQPATQLIIPAISKEKSTSGITLRPNNPDVYRLSFRSHQSSHDHHAPSFLSIVTTYLFNARRRPVSSLVSKSLPRASTPHNHQQRPTSEAHAIEDYGDIRKPVQGKTTPNVSPLPLNLHSILDRAIYSTRRDDHRLRPAQCPPFPPQTLVSSTQEKQPRTHYPPPNTPTSSHVKTQ
jgi:hypothetical protein